MWLRVPGLRYGRVKGTVYAVLFAVFDALVFGTLGVSQAIRELLGLRSTVCSIRFGLALPICFYLSEKVRRSLHQYLLTG